MKAYLDGIPVAFPNDSIAKPTITLRRKDDDGENAFSFTGDLVFTGKDFDYVYQKLVTDLNALVNQIVFTLEEDCCSPSFITEYIITHDSVEFCEGECMITAAAIEKSNSVDQHNCLKSKLIWDDTYGFKSKQHPRFAYCNELRPNWLHDVVLILSVATATSILVFIPVIASLILLFNTINAVINFCNNNLGTNFNNITFNGQTQIDLNDLQDYMDLLTSFIVGCGRKHPSPLVRDYADNICKVCGITFQSSIYKNPSSEYHNAAYVNAPIHKGTLEPDLTTYWIDENKPIANGNKFFDEVAGIVNGDWRVVGNVLTLERRDFFKPTGVWLDLTTYNPVIGGIDVCWKWSNKSRYAYAVLEYFKDGVNWVGSEAVERWSDIIDWNVPYSPSQKDEFRPLIQFAACRFRDDGIDRDVLSTYKNFPTVGPMIKKYDNAMIMNSHTCYTPMLLIWDDTTPLDNAKCKTSYGGTGINANQSYNYPFWFDANHSGNLYDRFWSIDNPRASGFKGMDFTATFVFDCKLLPLINIDGSIKTSRGDAEISSIELNFATNQITIKGTV